MLNEIDDDLTQTHRLAYETQNIGITALATLQDGNDRLQRLNDETLEDMDDSIDKSRGILSIMKRRIISNKLILLFIIVLLVIANFVVIFIKWIYPHINPDTPGNGTTPVPPPNETVPPLSPPSMGNFI